MKLSAGLISRDSLQGLKTVLNLSQSQIVDNLTNFKFACNWRQQWSSPPPAPGEHLGTAASAFTRVAKWAFTNVATWAFISVAMWAFTNVAPWALPVWLRGLYLCGTVGFYQCGHVDFYQYVATCGLLPATAEKAKPNLAQILTCARFLSTAGGPGLHWD